MAEHAACAAHPGAPATGVCARCGAFACADCLLASRCARCRSLALAEKPSPRAKAALVLATAGFCGFVPGLLGLGLAYAELGRIRRGESPAAGESYALLARNLGWFHAAMLALTLAVVLSGMLS